MEVLDKHRGIVLILAIIIILIQLIGLLKSGFNYLDNKYVCIEKMSSPIKPPVPKKFMTSVGGFNPPPGLFSSGQCCFEDCYTSGNPGDYISSDCTSCNCYKT